MLAMKSADVGFGLRHNQSAGTGIGAQGRHHNQLGKHAGGPTLEAGPAFAVVSFMGNEQTPAARSYLRCGGTKRARGVIRDVLEENGIEEAAPGSADYDMYYPCSFAGVERQFDEATELFNGRNQDAKVFAVDGGGEVHSKHKLWAHLQETFGRSGAAEVMPESYLVDRPSDITLFRRTFDPTKHYILKRNVERKKGLTLFGPSPTAEQILGHVDDRTNNGRYVLIQNYISNVHLVKGHKLNLRLYCVLACGSKSEGSARRGFVHTNGKCLYTNKEYDIKSKNPESHITSLRLDANRYLEKELPLTVPQLRAYWRSIGIDHHAIFDRIYSLLGKTLESVAPSVCNDRRMDDHLRFQHFGADVILTRALKPLLMELNYGPAMGSVNADDYNMKKQVVEDMFAGAGVIPPPARDRPGDQDEGFVLLGEARKTS